MTFRVYRAERPVSWSGSPRHNTGDLVVDPPEFVTERLGSYLERLDEGGRLPRDTLRHMHYQDLQQLAAAGPIDDVDGNSSMEAIIDAYALDSDADDETEED